MQILKHGFVILIALLLTCSAGAMQLPASPVGYSWVYCKEIRAAFLLPSGWYFKKGVQGETLGYYFTRENIDQQGEFYTGLSVNVIPHIPNENGVGPSTYATSFIKATVAQREVYQRPWKEKIGALQTYGVVLINRDQRWGDYISYNLAVANDRTGTLYLLTFESPAENWQSLWPLVEPMLSQFLIDDSI